jgi:hypothetical protein
LALIPKPDVRGVDAKVGLPAGYPRPLSTQGRTLDLFQQADVCGQSQGQMMGFATVDVALGLLFLVSWAKAASG